MTRDTRQRRAIRAVFEDAEGPLGPQEVLHRAKGAVPNLGLATVYRTIKIMLEDAELTAVELPGEPSRYEAAERGRSHHHFFKCQDCMRVFDIHGCVDKPESLAPDGFRVTNHHIVLYGHCEREDCKPAG